MRVQRQLRLGFVRVAYGDRDCSNQVEGCHTGLHTCHALVLDLNEFRVNGGEEREVCYLEGSFEGGNCLGGGGSRMGFSEFGALVVGAPSPARALANCLVEGSEGGCEVGSERQ